MQEKNMGHICPIGRSGVKSKIKLFISVISKTQLTNTLSLISRLTLLGPLLNFNSFQI